MRFTWFNLMPWPYLPDYFREKNHSVWRSWCKMPASLGAAGKILFPIPERGLAGRLCRIKARTLVIWGESDKLISPMENARSSGESCDRRNSLTYPSFLATATGFT